MNAYPYPSTINNQNSRTDKLVYIGMKKFKAKQIKMKIIVKMIPLTPFQYLDIQINGTMYMS